MKAFNNFLEFLQNNQVEEQFFEEIMNVENIEDIVEVQDIIIDTLSTEEGIDNIFHNGFLFFYKGNNANTITNIDWEEICNIYKNRDNISVIETSVIINTKGILTQDSYFHDLSENKFNSIMLTDKVFFLNKNYRVFKIDKKRNKVLAVLLNKKGTHSKNKYIIITEQIIETKTNGNHEVYGALRSL